MPQSSRFQGLFWIWLVAIFFLGCAAAPDGDDPFAEGEFYAEREAALSAAQRKTRAALIRDTAKKYGITTGFLLAGVADAETRMAHCWSELTWACKGPASPDCGGGPVAAGAGDGPCYLQQGGLGMFQFDAGTYQQTLAREGTRILLLEGNIAAAVDFMIEMVQNSAYISGVSTKTQAIHWINGVRVNNSRFEPWIKTIVRYYNGCHPNWSCWSQRYAHYRSHALGVWNEMGGQSFWFQYQASPSSSPAWDPIEVYWSRQPSGVYHLRSLANASVQRVVYRVDGHTIGSATRQNGTNFPDSYRFNVSKEERLFEVLGYDGSGKQVALGIGLMDVTAGTGVYIKQMGHRLYEIGLERPPSGLAAIEVRVDGHGLKDSVSGETRSTRIAVRSQFHQVGPRHFQIDTFNADGSYRGTLRRDFNLR